jgi:hypothetical protein
MVRAAQEILRGSSKLTEENVGLCAIASDSSCKSPAASASQPSTSPLYGRDGGDTHVPDGAISSTQGETHHPNVSGEGVIPVPLQPSKKAKKAGVKKKKSKRKLLESSEESDSDADWMP